MNKPEVVVTKQFKYIVDRLEKTIYPSNESLAVIAYTSWDDGLQERVRLSVNLDHANNKHASNFLEKDEFFFDVNNQKAIFEILLKAKWIEKVGKEYQGGYVFYPACKLTDKAVL